MAIEVFTWSTPFAKLKRKPRIKGAEFGDGYAQESADGLNAAPESWSLVFKDRYANEIVAIDEFLVARNAVEKFAYTTNMGKTIFVKCQEWDVEPGAERGETLLTLTATFNQVP